MGGTTHFTQLLVPVFIFYFFKTWKSN